MIIHKNNTEEKFCFNMALSKVGAGRVNTYPCQTNSCMAWKWVVDRIGETEYGYCGLVNHEGQLIPKKETLEKTTK